MAKTNKFTLKKGKGKQVHLTYEATNSKMVFAGEPQHNKEDLKETLQNFITAIKNDDFIVIDATGLKHETITLD